MSTATMTKPVTMTKKQMIANAEKKGVEVSSSEKKEVIWEKVNKEEKQAEMGLPQAGEY